MTPKRLEYLLNEVVLRGECADISSEELYEALRALAKSHVLERRIVAGVVRFVRIWPLLAFDNAETSQLADAIERGDWKPKEKP